MLILGISAFFHDSAAAIILDGRVVAAAQEERFTRVKHDAGFPDQAVRYCLEAVGAKVDELDAVVFYDKPLLKLERILGVLPFGGAKGMGGFFAVDAGLDEAEDDAEESYPGSAGGDWSV